jgi:hypothetical protein
MENLIRLKTNFKILLVTLTVVIFSNCSKETAVPDKPTSPDGKIVYILNEGNFQSGNASISHLNITDDSEITLDYFNAVNGFKLGDILQSMGENDDNYYIVVNNSAKIEVVDKVSFKYVMTITDMGSPRYFLAINDTLAYVTDLFAGAIHQINPSNGSKYNDIEVDGWSEQMQQIGDEVFVTLFGASAVGVVNVLTQSLVDNIALDLPPVKIFKDKFNKLWVMSSDFNGTTKLYKIDAESKSIENTWEFAPASTLFNLTIDPDGSYIYYASELYFDSIKINKLDVSFSGNELVPEEVFETQALSIYGLNVNKEGDIYI